MDEMTQKGNSTGGCDVVAGAWRAEERPWGGARESQGTEKSQRSDWKREMLVWKKNEKSRSRRDNGSVFDPPIYASFGPQNITVITSQESHYWNAFFDQIYKNPFSTSSKLWLLGCIIHRWKGMNEEIAAPLES